MDAFFVVGFPGETKEQIRRTFAFARSLDLDYASWHIATPYPGTELEAICRAEGYLEDMPVDRLRVKRGNITTPEFTSAELEQMMSRELPWQTVRLLARPRVFIEWVALRVWRDPQWALGNAARPVRRKPKQLDDAAQT